MLSYHPVSAFPLGDTTQLELVKNGKISTDLLSFLLRRKETLQRARRGFVDATDVLPGSSSPGFYSSADSLPTSPLKQSFDTEFGKTFVMKTAKDRQREAS